MTRIALLSDIHANVLALEAVYDALFRHADEFWVLGDILGYGPKPTLTYDLLASIQPTLVLAGNHDWYIIPQDFAAPDDAGRLPGPSFRRETDGTLSHIGGPRPVAWDVALRHRRLCTPQMIATLSQLPVQQQVGSHFFVAHALYIVENNTEDEAGDAARALETRLVSPGDFEPHYLNPQAPWHLADMSFPVLHISGHTHQRELWERPRTSNGIWQQYTVQPNTPYNLQMGMMYHINPGSVGQPRTPHAPCPSAALLDTELQNITFIEVPYAVEIVRKQMRELDYPEELYAETQLLPCP